MRHTETAQLSQADQEALNALVEHGYQIDKLPPVHRERAECLLELLSLLDHLPTAVPAAPVGDLLTARTLQGIQRSRQQDRFTQQIDAMTTRSLPGVSMSELGAVAAMLVLGLSLLWPVLSNARDVARQVACQSNLASAGFALNSYAMDHEGAMPATHAHLGDPWWETNSFNADGTTRSNSAHLFTLASSGYIGLGRLSCAENADSVDRLEPEMRDWPTSAAASFSYQNQFASSSRRHRLGIHPEIAVLADKSPLFEPGRYRDELSDSNSLNHEGGQNVLLSNGEVRWMAEPVVNGRDNIFHAGYSGFDYYTGREGPAAATDSFLVP